MPQQPLSLDFLPGIQRDGTLFDANRAPDSLWARIRLGRWRKMGGYQSITDELTGVPRNIHIYYQGATAIVHVGTTASLQQIVIDYNGNLISITDRTPLAGFSANILVGWTIDALFDDESQNVYIIAHAVPDTGLPTSQNQTVPFYGIITQTARLTQFTTPPSGIGGGAYTQPLLGGGIVCVQPYVFGYDINGGISWSAPSLPLTLGVTGGTTGAGSARESAQKIMKGLPIRGGGAQQPAAVFWSASEVITASFVGSAAGVFSFSTVSSSSSFLSTESAIEYDGLFFWAGIDRFLMFNGVVQEVPNTQNQDWFFNNLNWAYAGKVVAMKIPRYGEIWWLAPMFGNTECSHAIIYNVRENCWYDTVLPNQGRSCGATAQGLRFPIMGGVLTDSSGWTLWAHEMGVNEINKGVLAAVRSYYETPYLPIGPKGQQPVDNASSVQQFEPDFIQSGDLNAYIIGAPNARGPVSMGTAEPVKANPSVPQEQFTSFKETHRLVRMHVESNTLDGNYISGKNILHVGQSGDKRLIG